MGRMRFSRYAETLFIAMALFALGWCSYTTVQYLKTSSHFQLENVAISGLKRVDENQVLAKIGFQLGTNVFMADLDEIRRKVEELSWVRHATVQRVLPDRLRIRVAEREPIGLSRIRGDIYLFDEDARILEPEAISLVSFPVLEGLRVGEADANALKVALYRRVIEELGETGLSEVHINDAGEVSVVSGNDPLLVHLGKEDFQGLWLKFLQLKLQIQQQYPSAVRVDLRFRNQIVVSTRDGDASEEILWDAEKKAL